MTTSSALSQFDSVNCALHFLSPGSALMEPFAHVARLPSKNIRNHFVVAIGEHLLHLSPLSLLKLNAATSILHSASLVFDDIEDGSTLRRGEPAAHVIFGMPLSLNSASAACNAALEVMLMDESEIRAEAERQQQEQQQQQQQQQGEESTAAAATSAAAAEDRQVSQVAFAAVSTCLRESLQPAEMQQLRYAALCGRLTRVYIDAMKLLHSGQGKDILWRDTHQCPTLAQYRLMARQKTGGLFRLVAMWAMELHCFEEDEKQQQQQQQQSEGATPAAACEIMFAASSSACPVRDPAWRMKLLALCDDFGLCFQILDDVSNLCDTKLHALKSFCDDIDEGKFSYAAIHCIQRGLQSSPRDTRLMHALRQHSQLGGPAASVGGQPVPRRERSMAEKQFCVGLMREAGSIDASVQEVLLLAEQLKIKLGELVGGGAPEAHQQQQQQAGGGATSSAEANASSSASPTAATASSTTSSSSSSLSVCYKMLMKLIGMMAEKAQQFSSAAAAESSAAE